MIERRQGSRAIAERNLLADAKSEWITDLRYSFQDGENLYLAMEFLPGGDLMTRLIKQDIFSEAEARFYAAEMVMAVDQVHSLGYIHRDIKPDNILIDQSGHIKLTDFGLCKFLLEYRPQRPVSPPSADKPGRGRLYSTVGTPDYIAPEVFSKKGYTQAVDWWAFGVILFEMLAGYTPFNDRDPTVTCKRIVSWKKFLSMPREPPLSPEAADLILRLLCD